MAAHDMLIAPHRRLHKHQRPIYFPITFKKRPKPKLGINLLPSISPMEPPVMKSPSMILLTFESLSGIIDNDRSARYTWIGFPRESALKKIKPKRIIITAWNTTMELCVCVTECHSATNFVFRLFTKTTISSIVLLCFVWKRVMNRTTLFGCP